MKLNYYSEWLCNETVMAFTADGYDMFTSWKVHNYCKLGNFRENFIFANSVKRHICDKKKNRDEGMI